MFQSDWRVTHEVPKSAEVIIAGAADFASVSQIPLSRLGESPMVFLSEGQPPIVVVPEGTTRRKVQKAFKEAAKLARQFHPGEIAVAVDHLSDSDRRPALFGIGQGLYQYRKPDEDTVGARVAVVTEEPKSYIDQLVLIKYQSWVRDLINIPSNLKPPERLASLIKSGSPSTIEWSLFDQKSLRDMGAGGILAVGEGSHRPPVLLVGRYEGQPGAPFLALIGKGITFDSGGISLKPGDGMGRMKGDMGGAAAVAGALRVLAEMHAEVNILAVMPLAENLPGGGAYRPGDVLTMMDGTQVEVISTDAEGRLVLADGVTWARRQGVSAIIDMATLTGANVVALGGIRSGLITNHDVLGRLVVQAADAGAEPTWELPHDEDYQDLNKTSAADIKNSGGRPAGTVTAGLFIGHFAGSVPWAHLDIAGLSFDADGGIGAGATGYGVSTLVEAAYAYARAPVE